MKILLIILGILLAVFIGLRGAIAIIEKRNKS